MEHSQTFTVNINGKKIQCPRQVCKMSTFLNNLLYLGMDTFDLGLQGNQENEQQQIYIELIDEDTFMRFLEFCQLNEYKQPIIITPIKTNKLQQVLNQKNLKFIQKLDYDTPQLVQLLKAAQFLGCKALEKVIAVKFACLIYFEDSRQAYEQKCKELKTENSINYEDDEKYKKLYSFMNV